MQVPFLFKYTIDYLNNTPLVIADAETAVVSLATLLILGCKLQYLAILNLFLGKFDIQLLLGY